MKKIEFVLVFFFHETRKQHYFKLFEREECCEGIGYNTAFFLLNNILFLKV